MFDDAHAVQRASLAISVSDDRGNAPVDLFGPWLQRTALGDERAFRQLYDATSHRLLGQAMAMLRARDAAEDALQEAFVRIWSSARHYDPARGHALAWMTRVMRNVSIDHLRRQRLTARYLTSDEDMPEVSIAPEPVDDRLDLIDALGQLPREQRNTISMVVVQGWTHEEVARHEGIPTATTKSRAQRGLRRLRGALEREPIEWGDRSDLKMAAA